MQLDSDHGEDVEEDWWNGWRKKVRLAVEVEADEVLEDPGWREKGESRDLGNPLAQIGTTHDELRILIYVSYFCTHLITEPQGGS